MNDIVDMSQFIEAKSDQLNADDLIGTTRTITVRRVTGNDGDQPVSIFYEGDNNKPFKPCKTMRRVLMGVWGRNGADYVGRSMTLYRDDKVTFGGLEVGGIRISHMSHIDKETIVVVMKTKGKKAGIKIQPLKAGASSGSPRQTPQQWAASHRQDIDAAATVEDLDAVIKAGTRAMDKLKGASPDLHAEVETAYETRRAAITREGRADEQMGDQFGNDDFAYEGGD